MVPLALVGAFGAGCGDGGDSQPAMPRKVVGDAPAADAGDGTALPGDALPRQGEALMDVDWAGMFPAGDGWKEHEQEFVFNNGAEPETLDPHLMTGVPEHTLALALFEGLTAHHPRTLQAMPGVAAWWEISEDGLVYTFHLRDDAKWTNGETVTAEDFRWSWERALSPATASQYAYQLYAVKNAEAFNKGEVKDIAEVGMKALDDVTFEVTLGAPTPYFLDLTSFETLMPVHRATVEKHGLQWTRSENFVGNGPFTLSEWKPRDEIVMTQNEHYWNSGIVRLTKIRAKAMDDMNTAFNEYLAGSMDWLKAIPQKRIDEVQMHPDYYVWPYLGCYFFRFNITRAPFDDVRVRKAFNLAVDKQSLCVDTLKAGQIPATGYVPPGIHGYTGVQGDDYDPAKAKQLLAEAGFPGGEGFPEVELVYNTSESHKQNCEVISSMWREVLGVNIKLRNMEWKIYLDDVDNLRYQVARAGWIGDYTDPNTFMDMFVTDGGNNNTGFANAEFDQLIRDAAIEQDPGKRAKLFQRGEQILCVEEMPILPLYFYVNQGMLRPRVKGLDENIRDLHPFQFIFMDGPPARTR
jgi:oligopeptide transport system substrate-binding protein